MREEYHKWLEAKYRDPRTRGYQLWRIRKIEEAYGDLDVEYARDQLASIIDAFTYTADDARHNRPNETRLTFAGPPSKNLHSYKFAVAEYRRFLEANEPTLPARLPAEEGEPDDSPEYIPEDGDERQLVERQIRERRGRDCFRNALRERYADRCVVTGCEIVDLLEAAHIKPYRSEADNHPANGLLLRADIHTLFDLDLLSVEPERLIIELHPVVASDATYRSLAGRKLICPNRVRPSKEALKLRYTEFQRYVGD